MASNRPMTVTDAAQNLNLRVEQIEKMIAVGQIRLDSTTPKMVTVRYDSRKTPRFAPVAPVMKDTFEAVSVAVSASTSTKRAAEVLQVLASIGFLVKNSLETHITPTAHVTVATVPEIQNLIEDKVGKGKVRTFITAYKARGSNSLT